MDLSGVFGNRSQQNFIVDINFNIKTRMEVESVSEEVTLVEKSLTNRLQSSTTRCLESYLTKKKKEFAKRSGSFGETEISRGSRGREINGETCIKVGLVLTYEFICSIISFVNGNLIKIQTCKEIIR